MRGRMLLAARSLQVSPPCHGDQLALEPAVTTRLVWVRLPLPVLSCQYFLVVLVAGRW